MTGQNSGIIRAGVIGWPIAQSRSPLIHQTWLRQHAINGAYEKYAVKPEELPGFIKGLRSNGFAGLNLTIPHKEAVLPLVDKITKEAKAIGAANTLWFEGEACIAGNTDAYGFITHLKTKAPRWRSDAPAMVLGAGGAARAVLYALQAEGVPEIYLTNRTLHRAETLAGEFQAAFKATEFHVIPWPEKTARLDKCHLLVNTTSLGMTGKDELNMDISPLPEGATVYDIVYVPLKTRLLHAAEKKGLTTVDGLGMLLHQAVPGFAHWFGPRPTVSDTLYDLVLADIETPKAGG